MAGFMEKILNKFSITDEDDMDDFDDFDDFDNGLPAKKEKKPEYPMRAGDTPVMRKDTVKGATVTTTRPVARQSRVEDSFDDFQERKERVKPVERSSSNRVVPMRSARFMEVNVMRPTRFDDSQAICDVLVGENATIVNLEGIDLALAQRIMDFVSGAVYSLNGKIHQISSLIFIVSPENVEISGDYLSYIEQNSFEVPTLNR